MLKTRRIGNGVYQTENDRFQIRRGYKDDNLTPDPNCWHLFELTDDGEAYWNTFWTKSQAVRVASENS